MKIKMEIEHDFRMTNNKINELVTNLNKTFNLYFNVDNVIIKDEKTEVELVCLEWDVL